MTLTAGNGKLTAAWAAPANGGSAITGYTVEHKVAGAADSTYVTVTRADAAALTETITGLTNDTEYTVRVRAGNDAGNGPWSTEASETPIAGDTTAPEVSSATVSSDGAAIDIVFDEDLDTTGSEPAADAFEVTVDGGTAVNPASVAFHASDADTVVLTMSPAIAAGATVSVDYDQPTSNALADAASNEVADFTGQAAPNRPAAPGVTLTAGNGKLTATWTAPANGGSAITGYDVEWKTAAQTWAEAATAGQSDTAAADATTHEITGLTNGTAYTVRVRAGNDAGDGPWSVAVSATPAEADLTAPSVSEARLETDSSDDYKIIKIVFDEDLDGDSAPAASTFNVAVDGGTAVNPATVAISGATVTLTMAAEIAAGATVTVAYTEPTAGPLQDLADDPDPNQVESFTGNDAIAVPNRPAAPTLTLAPAAGQITASWEAPANGGAAITGYEVQYKASADSGYTTVSRADAEALSETITSLVDGTRYTVRVRAVNDAGNGPRAVAATIAGDAYPPPGGPWLFDGGRGGQGFTAGFVLVRWLPPTSAASDADLQGWEIQWRSGSENWSTSRQWYVGKDRDDGGLRFEHRFSGLHSYGTEYEFRVRARVTGSASLWTNAVAVTVRRSDAPDDMDFDNVSFEDPDEEVGEDDVSSKVIFRVHDSLERTVNDEGLVEVKVVRSLWMESYHRDETVPITGALLRFGADGRQCSQWGREGDGFDNNRDIDLEILHPGAAKADWEHVGWSENQYEIAQRNFACYYKFKGILPRNAVAAAQQFVVTPGTGTYRMEDPDPDVAQLSGAVSGNGALTISWQQEMWAGARVLADFSQEGYEGKTLPHTEHFPVIQWVVADQEFSDDLHAAANDFGDDSGVHALDGDELKTVLLAAEYTITGLENGTAYKVRFAYGYEGADQSVNTSLTSNVVTGTPELVEPVAGSAAVSEDGETIDIVFDQDLDTNVSAPAASAFTVTVGTAPAVNPDNAAFHATDATTITLTMDSADTIAAGDTVSVTYTKPSTNVIQNSNDQETDGFAVSATNRPAAPGTPTLTSGAGTLDVTWTAPAADGGSPVTGYTVQWRTGSQTWDDAVAEGQTASAAASPYQITGLVPVAYTVRVVATNVAGSGPPSPEQTATPTAARPTITAVAVTSTPKAATDTYGLGEDIEITVEFNEAVEVEGDVIFRFNTSGQDSQRQARLARGSGTDELVFAYTVQSGDTDTNGIWIGHPDHANHPTLSLDTGQSITSALSGLEALLEHDEEGTQGDHKVDGSLTAADATLSALSLSGITLDQTFTAGAAGTATTSFTAATMVSSTMVTATPSQSGGSSAVDIDPADADTNTTGHQVSLDVGDTVITVTVTSSNGASTRTYTVTVTREAATDSTAPAVASAAVSTDGAAIDIEFDEDLDTSGAAPAADAFEVTVDGGTAVNPASVAFHATDSDTVVLTMSPAIAAGATVSVDYDEPTTNPLKDAADNAVESFTGQAAANRAAADIEVSWAAESYAALEGHPGTTVTVTLSAVPTGDVTVPISESLGGGASDDDYSGVPASVTFDSASVLDGDGLPTESFTVVATDDDFHDGDGNDETVTLSFGTLTGVTAGTQETATVGLIDNEVPATSDLIPDGTAIGEGFRLLFVTSNKRDATSTDIDDYNRHVQSRAKSHGHEDIRPYSSQFQALASTEAVNARDNTATDPDDDGPGEEIWWLDGPKAADDYRDFYDNTWDHQNPGREEDGDEVDFEDEDKVWTGTDKDGTTRFPLGQNPSGFAEPFEPAGELFQGGSTTRPKNPLYGLSYVLHAAAPADAPYVTGVETVDLPDGPYRSGDTIKVRVIFSEAVTVNGAPTFPMEIGSDTRQAEYLATESTGTGLVFTHLVTDADYDNSSAGISNAELVLELPSGTSITRASDSTVDAYPGSIVWEPDRKVNRNPRLTDIEITSDPRSGSDSDTYGSREVIEFTVTFDVPVTVTGDTTEGNVTLKFFIGEGLWDQNERYADLSTSDGTELTRQLVFTYTVVSLDVPRDGGVVFINPSNDLESHPPFELEGDQSIQGRLGRDAKLETIKNKRTYPGHMVNGTLTPPPVADTSPPENLRAFAGKARIDLEWDEPSAGAPAGGYRVRWRKSSESAFAASDTADVATGTEYSVSGLSDGDAHVVQVASLDASSDPGDWVEAQATVGRPKAVSNLTVQTRSQDFRLSWDAPDERGAGFLQDSANNPVLVYRVSWEETGQESDAVPYQTVCQTGTAAFDFYEYYDVEQSGNTITFKLRPPDNGEVYSFAVEARFQTGSAAVLENCHLQSDFGLEAETTETATEDAAMASEEDHAAVRAALAAVVDARDEEWPWLRTAWDHASAGTVQAADLDQGSQGKTGAECTSGSNSTENLGGCTFGKLEIDIDWDLLTRERFEYLAVHELAHVWTLVTDLHDQDTRAPVGRALLYFFGQEYEGDSVNMAVCATETLADALSHVAEGVAPADLAYYGNVCFSDGRTEPNATSEAVALHAMHPSGADPNGADTTSSWFTDTFTGDAASDDAWAAVSDIGTNRHRSLVMNLLQDEFNGLCSIKAGNVAASEDSDVISPWTDGGCEPDAPTGVTATAGSAAGSIDVSWTAPAEAGGAPLLGYTVQWKVHVQSWPQEGFISPTQQAVIDDSAATSHTIAGITPGLEYTVRVRARNSIGDGVSADQSVIAASAARSTPPPPKNVRAVEEKGGVRLTWQPPDGATVTGYRIERRRADEDRGGQRSHGRPRDHHTLVEDSGSADTGYTDESAEKGVEYEYRVSARNEAGPGEGSDWVRAGPGTASNNPATGAPTISGTAQVGETLTAGISGIADADGLSGETFAYQWVSSDGTTDTDIAGATGSTYTLAAADQGRSVKVRVTFTDDGGNEETLTSAPTEPVLGDGLPGAPRNLAATPGNKEITLSWEPPADNGNAPATRYRIEWRVDGKDYDKNHWGTARSTTYTTNDQANLANGVKYFFRVKAENDDGNSHGPYGPASGEVSATPTSGSAVDLGTPVLSDTENLHHRMVKLDWQDIEDAGWYVVQYYHVEDGEWLDLPAEGVDIAFHGSSAVVSNLHGLSWLRVGAASCDGASEWSQIEELYGTKESDWEGVPVPEVEEGDETEPCPVVLGTPVLSDTEYLHHGMVQLDWEDIEDAGWYVVQYYRLEDGEWLDLPAEGVDIAFHGSSAVVSNLHGLSWLRVRAMSCAGASEWSQIEQFFGTNASDWEDVSVPDVAEGDEIEPCSEDADTPGNSPATGAPTITGTAQVGETLEADTSGVTDADGLSNVQYEYQWLADDVDISGATSSTYTLTDSEEGKAIKVEVSFTDDAGNEETLTSVATDAVAAAPQTNSPATGAPTINGTAQVGETLTANTSGIADADGLSNVQYEYQWLADDTDISGATGSTYTLAAEDGGKAIKVEVTFTDDADNEESLTSATTDAVAAVPTPNSPATGAPTITGTVQVEETLTANTSGIADEDGLTNATYSFQWLADDTEIAGATSLTYTLVDADEGKAVKVEVTFTDDAGNDETLTSAATDAVAAAPAANSPATGVPTISGTAQVGETLTANTSGVADEDGLDEVSFTYQWLADDSDISGATNATYTLVAADEGKATAVEVSFTDDEGNAETLTSEATEAVAATPAPDNTPATGAPTISGTAQVGETLTAGTSGVADADGLSNIQYEYQWLADDADISGATNATYTLAAADEGKAISVQVSFTDDGGNAETLTSAATEAVSAAPTPNSPATGTPTISGTAQVGETLTAGTSGIADEDGLGNVQYEYQWLADDAGITGATSLTYTLAAADQGKAIKVEVSFTDDEGNAESLTSAATDAVAAAPAPNSPAAGVPTISGTAQVGETLTANTSGIADADGLANATFSYQWLADDAEIAGATGLTYTLTDSEESKAITVQVSFTDDADNEETLTSAATGAVAGAQPTEPPAKPTGLDATATHASVSLTWDDPGDDSITGYVILQRIPGVDPEGHFDVLVANTGTAATTYTDDTVSAETRYTYRIKAINGAGTSERSRWSHIDTPAAPVPDQPTGLEATESHGQVVLTWDDPGDDSITGYVILRRVRENDTGGDFSVLVADTGTAALTYTDDTVAASTTYTYRIKAINDHGVSERSRWVHIDTPAAP